MTKYDIYVQPGTVQQAKAGRPFTFGAGGTVAVRGRRKTLAIYEKCLCTARGSDPLDLTYGTGLSSLIGSNVTVNDARDVIALAVQDASRQVLRLQQSASLPLDERLSSVAVADILAYPALPGVSVTINLRFADGGTAAVTPPTIPLR